MFNKMKLLLLVLAFVFTFDSEYLLREDLVRECLERGRQVVQTITDALFSLPSTEDRDGPLVKLPPPTTKLPREKHVKFLFLF